MDKEELIKLIRIPLFIIAAAVAYYLVIYVPSYNEEQLSFQKQQVDIQKQKDLDQVNAQKQKEAEQALQQTLKSQALQSCLDQASATYTLNWNNDCKIHGYDKLTDGCLLPSYNSSRWNTQEQQDKDNCFKQYPQ